MYFNATALAVNNVFKVVEEVEWRTLCGMHASCTILQRAKDSNLTQHSRHVQRIDPHVTQFVCYRVFEDDQEESTPLTSNTVLKRIRDFIYIIVVQVCYHNDMYG